MDANPSEDTGAADPFVSKVTAELRRLGQEKTRLLDEEEELRRQRSTIQRSISELEGSLEVYRRTMGLHDESAGTESDADNRRWADVAFDVVAVNGGRMRVADLVEALARLRPPGPEYATVYSSLKRDERFGLVAAGEFEIVEPSDEAVLREIAEGQLRQPFVGLKQLADRRRWHTKIGDLLERGLIVKYPVPNPHNPNFPTSALRIALDVPEARELTPATLVRQLDRSAAERGSGQSPRGD